MQWGLKRAKMKGYLKTAFVHILVSDNKMSTQSQSHVDAAMETTQTYESGVTPPPPVDDNEYYAGMIDAQMNVTLSKNDQVRVVLSSNDPRIAEHISAKFMPTRITIVKRPQKKDVCTILFVGEQSKPLLEFAMHHCKVRKRLAEKTLMFMDKKIPAHDLKQVPLDTAVENVTLDYASGMFDVRSIVTMPKPATETTKKKRGNVKVVVPKAEAFIIPALQKVLHGRVKKTSPCRLVYESKDMIGTLKHTVEHHIRAKAKDLMMLD